MTAARAKAPTLAWLLTALTGLLAGMAIVESRHQAVVLPVWTPIGPVVTAEATAIPTTTPEVTQTTTPEPPSTPILGPGEQLAPAPTPLAADVPVWLPAGTAHLRLERLVVAPGTSPRPAAAPGPTVLLVEVGALSVLTEGAAYVGQGLDAVQTDTVLGAGERLVVAAGARYAVRNDGSTSAVALVVTVLPVDTPGAEAAPRRWCRGCG